MKKIALLIALMAGVGYDAPSVVNIVPTSGTTLTVQTGTPSAGQRQVVLVARPGSTGNIIFPAGWVKQAAVLSGGSFAPYRCGLTLAYHDADGTEGASIAIAGASGPLEAVAYTITGHDSATAPAFKAGYGNGASPDPYALSAPWGVNDNLWIAAMCAASGASLLSFPMNYVNDQYSVNGAPTLAIASRVATAGYENPGAFGISPSRGWATITIGIKP